jgi:hypothetical protein
MIDKLQMPNPADGAAWSSTPLPAPAAAGSDVERFQVALNTPNTLGEPRVGPVAWSNSTVPATPGPASAAATTLPPTSTESVATRAAQAGRRSVGDTILDTFRSAAQNASTDWVQARQAIMRPDMTATQMLQTQMQLINVSFQIDLIGKGVTKVTTNLEQTLKVQ